MENLKPKLKPRFRDEEKRKPTYKFPNRCITSMYVRTSYVRMYIYNYLHHKFDKLYPTLYILSADIHPSVC